MRICTYHNPVRPGRILFLFLFLGVTRHTEPNLGSTGPTVHTSENRKAGGDFKKWASGAPDNNSGRHTHEHQSFDTLVMFSDVWPDRKVCRQRRSWAWNWTWKKAIEGILLLFSRGYIDVPFTVQSLLYLQPLHLKLFCIPTLKFFPIHFSHSSLTCWIYGTISEYHRYLHKCWKIVLWSPHELRKYQKEYVKINHWLCF